MPLPHLRTAALLLLVAVPALVAQAPAPQADTPFDEAFVLPDDLEVTLWAESPLFFNPTNIDVDARGRVWVTEAVNYRTFKGRDGYRAHDAGDRVVILEDTDGDGRADTSTVFVQDADLHAPLGLAVLGDRVVVSSAPNLIVYTDWDGDDRPEGREILLTGFGSFDHDHGLHALTAGPDGRWYFNTGNAGPHVVADRAGWTLRSGSMYTGGTPYNTENHGGRVSDDGRVWVGGLALRMRPDGTGLEVLAHNFRNAYELAVDSYGDLWQNDNDDEVVACRTTWLMEGANAGFFSADGTRAWPADRRPGQDTFTAHWHQEDPGVLPAGDRTGAGAPTGIVVYEGDALGPAYRGLLLSADAGRNVVFGYRTVPEGAGFRLERSDFLSSVAASTEGYVWNDSAHFRDLRKWFRPSDVAVGTDGALYVADWYDPIVGGHEMKDSTGYGRIYRIAPKGRKLAAPTLDLATTEGRLAALRSPAVNVRFQGFTRLRAQGSAAVAPVKTLLADANPYVRARAVWLLAQLGPAGEAEVERLLQDPDERLRVAAYRALAYARGFEPAVARRLAADPSPAARRAVALSLRDVPTQAMQDVFLALADGFDGADPWYLEALGLAADGREDTLYAALYTMLRDRYGAAPEAPADRLAAFAWRLHPPAAVDYLRVRAAAPTVPEAERRRALTGLAFVDDERAAQAMADLTRAALPDVAEQAAWWMRFRRTNDWRGYAVTGWQEPPVAAAAPPSERVRALRAVMTDAARPIDARADAAYALASDPAGAGYVLAAAAERTLSYQLQAAVRRALYLNPDPVVRTLAGAFFEPPAPASITLDAVAALDADPERGRLAFFSRCAACHVAAGVGADVGPDLSGAGTKFDRAGLVEAILQPAAAVAHGFEPWIVTTHDGNVHVGFVLADGETVVLKDVHGRRLSFDRTAVATRSRVETSLMPPPGVLGLTAQEVADVAAFLLAQETPER